jgi:hypothetical protein
MPESEGSRRPKTPRTDSDRSSKAGSGQHRRDRKSTPESEVSAPRTPGRKHKRREKSASDDALLNSSSNMNPPLSTSPSKSAHPPSSPPTTNPLNAPVSPTPIRDGEAPASPTRRKDKTPASPAPAIDEVPASPTRRKHKVPAIPAQVIDEVPASPTRRRDKVPTSPAQARDEVPASPTRRKHKVSASPALVIDEVPASPTRRKQKVSASPAQARDEVPASPTRRKHKLSAGAATTRDEVPASPVARTYSAPVSSAPRRERVPASPAPTTNEVPASPTKRKGKVPASAAPRRDTVPGRDEAAASRGARRDSAPASSAPRRDKVSASPAPTRDEVPASPTKRKGKVPASAAPRRDTVPGRDKAAASPGARRDSAPASTVPRKDKVPASPTRRKQKVPASPVQARDEVPASPTRRKHKVSAGPAPTRDEVPARSVARTYSAPVSSAPRKDRVPASPVPTRDEVPASPAPRKDSALACPAPDNPSVSPPCRRIRTFDIGENCFDVDAPRDPVRQRPDCASVAESTVVDSLAEEDRAWAGIEAVLDDIESVATHDVLSEALIRSSSSSIPATSFLGKERPEDDNDDNYDDSHDAFMEGLSAEKSSHGDEMPSLASYSSLLSAVSIAQSILSCISKRNLILQEDLTDNPMKEFIGSITNTLERKQQAGPAPSSPDGDNGIFNMFSWSSKKNVDEIKGETQGMKESFIERHPEHEILMSPQPRRAFLPSPPVYVHEDACDKSLPSLSDMPSLSENSMPSLSSVRESEVSGSTHVRDKWASYADLNVDYGRILPSKALDPNDSADMSEKWASFGDLDIDYGRIPPMDQKVQFGDMPQTAERTSTKTKTKKAPKPVLKKKFKKKIGPIEVIKEINHPEALLDYYKAPALAVPETPASGSKKDKYGVALMRNFKSPVASLRNRMPKLGLFGKGRRNSPTSVTDGRQESQFYPEMDDDGEEGEEFGGLLSY